MSQRAVPGGYTKQPIAVVREHGSRIECIALVPWLVPNLLDHVGHYWLGDFAQHATPASSVLSALAGR